jgi:hypothetical protein
VHFALPFFTPLFASEEYSALVLLCAGIKYSVPTFGYPLPSQTCSKVEKEKSE